MDGAGVPRTDLEVTWSVSPAGAATSMGAGIYQIVEEGTVTFEACASLEGQAVCDTSTLLVDAGSPTLELSSPAAGAELEATAIEVIGTAMDSRGLVTVYVNGTRANVLADGSFRALVSPHFGVNHLEVSASDGVRPESRLERDVLWAPAYRPALGADGHPGVEVPDALIVQLDQGFFDDGAPAPLGGPIVAGDLADALELIVPRLDLRSELPDDGQLASGDFSLRIGSIALSDVEVAIAVLDGGLELSIALGSIRLTTEGSVRIGAVDEDLTGAVTLSALAHARLHLAKPDRATPADITLEGLDVVTEGGTSELASATATALFALASGSSLRGAIERTLSRALEGMLSEALPPLVGGVFGGIDRALSSRALTIDEPPLPPLQLLIDGGTSSLVAVRRDHVALALELSFRTAEEPVFPSTRGVALAGDGEAPFRQSSSLQIAARLSTLNSMLQVLWSSGILRMDATSEVPDALRAAVGSVRVDGRLPPILRAARVGEGSDLVLALGQLEVEVDALGQQTTFGVSMQAAVDLALRDNRLTIEVEDVPQLDVWVIRSAGASMLINEGVLGAILMGEVWPELHELLEDGLSFELPIPSLGEELATLAPDLEGLELVLRSTYPLLAPETSDYVLLEAEVVGTNVARRVVERKLGRPLSEAEAPLLADKVAMLGGARIAEVALDLDAPALADWLADPAAH